MCTLINEINNSEPLTTPFDLLVLRVQMVSLTRFSLAACEIIIFFFTYEKGVLDVSWVVPVQNSFHYWLENGSSQVVDFS